MLKRHRMFLLKPHNSMQTESYETVSYYKKFEGKNKYTKQL